MSARPTRRESGWYRVSTSNSRPRVDESFFVLWSNPMHVKPEKRLQWAREVLVQHGTKEDFLEKAGAFSSNAIAAPGKCCE